MLTPELQERLFPYIGGIVRNQGAQLLAAGGTADHVHLLIELSASMSIAEAARIIKTNTSKWIHENFPTQSSFQWQEGYGAFTVSRSVVSTVIAYIQNQEEHHRTRSFDEEFAALVMKHQLDTTDQLTPVVPDGTPKNC